MGTAGPSGDSPWAIGCFLGIQASRGQGPSLGPLLPLGLLRVGWAYIFLLGPSSLCSQGVDSALAQGPRFRMRVGRDTPSLAKGLPLPLSCVP